VFDRRAVFAEKMMFPEGCLWHDGSLYVAAPPQVWKLTDTDGDGTADRREVWHDGKTLTGCANDLHGPYVGLDGLIYWCKGAFAEQTYERPDGTPFVTKASHIFRHDPRGGFVEPILTGGMDNPVEVAFTRDGDAVLSCTFLQHPAGGKRDGLIHAVYGGVWGKENGVLEGHPRTGGLMPPMVHLGAAAPCGLTRLESGWGGDEVLAACSFNLHKVSRHVLRPEGATYATTGDDLISSDDVDFHPTDVIEDADGSLLIVDTGGWYKLCCPTSQLPKPDVAGAIYRLRRADAAAPDDPRGAKLGGKEASTAELVGRLADPRFAVRRRALDEVAKRGGEAVPELARAAKEGTSAEGRRLAVWGLSRIDSSEARAAVRRSIRDAEGVVARSAVRAAGLWRDAAAAGDVRGLLTSDDPHTRRAAAEALGRIGSVEAVSDLLAAARGANDDRFLFHAVTFALIEIAAPEPTRAGLAADGPGAVRAALFALDQMPGGGLTPEAAVAALGSREPSVRETGAWLLERHPEWDAAVAAYLASRFEKEPFSKNDAEELRALLVRFASRPAVRDLIAGLLANDTSPDRRRLALEAIASSGVKELPRAWAEGVIAAIQEGSPAEVSLAVAAAAAPEKVEGDGTELREALREAAASEGLDDETRLRALRAVAAGQPIDDTSFGFLRARLVEGATGTRLAAADILAAGAPTVEQLRALTEDLPKLGPMELSRVLPAYAKRNDDATGLRLVQALRESDAAADLPPETVKAALAKYGPGVAEAARPIFERSQADESERRARVDSLVPLVAQGDVRRGQAVFRSDKAACTSCHAIGYLGGKVGPDLTNIGKIRTERDLLEAILYPSASFVRSYEPVVVVTTGGQVHAGIPREEGDGVTLATAADKTVTIPRGEIEEMRPGTVSVMPAGLEKQLTPEQLADLVAFLRGARW
jgi:putative heme-binding domain-containing protein